MKGLLKYLGIIVIVIAASLLVYFGLTNATTNTTLSIAGVMFVAGIIIHIIINKIIKE